MIRDNDINVSRVSEPNGSQSGAPVIAPTFVSSSTPNGYGASYSAPLAAPVIPTTGYGNGFGGGGLLESVLLLSVLGNRGLGGYGNGYCGDTGSQVADQNISNLRKDVAQNATEVHKLGNEMQQAFAQQTASLASDFRNLDNQICETDKNAIRAQYEGKIATLESTNQITDRIDSTTGDIKTQIYGLSTAVASEFCDLRHLIERGNSDLALQAERNHNATTLQIERSFCKLTEDNLRAEIERLKEERACTRDSILMGSQTNSILNAIDSQLQRQTSQIVQFGTGNAAIPTTTSSANTVNS